MIVIVGDQPVAVAVDAALRARGDEVVKIGERELARRSSSHESLPTPLKALFLGIPPAPPATQLAELGVTDFDEAIEAGLIARFGILSDALPLLAAEAGRALVEVGTGSVAAGPGGAAEAAVSAALVGLARAAALEYAPDGVRVNALLTSPPVIGWPASADPEDVAKLALTLLEPGAGGATGALVACDGGVTAVVQLPPDIPDAAL